MRTMLAVGLGALLSSPGLVPVVSAEPGFPDLDAFTLVPISAYRNGVMAEFSTPDGIDCRFKLDRRDVTSTQELQCRGIPPDETAAHAAGENCAVVQAGGFIYRIYHQPMECVSTPRGALLPVGSKISAGDITCAVGDDELTACLDTRAGQRHGFVLQPSGSTAF